MGGSHHVQNRQEISPMLSTPPPTALHVHHVHHVHHRDHMAVLARASLASWQPPQRGDQSDRQAPLPAMGTATASPAQLPVLNDASPKSAAPAAGSYGTAPASYRACVLAHESGGDYTAVNHSSGAGGAWQFLPSTWSGLGLPGLPQDAPPAMQDQAFATLYAEAGASPWITDGCQP